MRYSDTTRAEVAHLLWCANQGYLLPQDREIVTNEMLFPAEMTHPDDLRERPGWFDMADRVLDAISAEVEFTPDWPKRPDSVWKETIYHGLCRTCKKQNRTVHVCDWIECPTGGWWKHRVHPDDDHDADVEWNPEEDMDWCGNTYTKYDA